MHAAPGTTSSGGGEVVIDISSETVSYLERFLTGRMRTKRTVCGQGLMVCEGGPLDVHSTGQYRSVGSANAVRARA